jgi:hypothetical protein
VQADRRERLRFPIALKMRYSPKRGSNGDGETCNISSTGLLFLSTEQFIVDSEIDLVVVWPYLLNGNCPLKLCIYGRVVRSSRIGTAVSIERYEFRTAGDNS